MPRHKNTPEFHRRRARQLEAFIVFFVGAVVAFVIWAVPADASYNHVEVCESTLRGYSSDDDIHRFGLACGASSFGGWGSYGHYSDGSVYVWGRFNFSYGKYTFYKGRCSGGDYAADWFGFS